MIPPDETEPTRDQPRATQHVLNGARTDLKPLGSAPPRLTRKQAAASAPDYEYIGMRLMGLAQLLARVDGAPGEGLHLDTEAAFLVMTELTEAAHRLRVG